MEGSFEICEARRRERAATLAARDHAAFSAIIYAGLRIQETTALKVEDFSFSRGEEQIRVARGKDKEEGRAHEPQAQALAQAIPKGARRYRPGREDVSPHLFLHEKGDRVTENTLRRRLYGWVRNSGIKKQDLKPQGHSDLSR